MKVYVMHISLILDPDVYWYDAYTISVILDPDYDGYIYDLDP